MHQLSPISYIVMALAFCQNIISAQYLENVLMGLDQILLMQLFLVLNVHVNFANK